MQVIERLVRFSLLLQIFLTTLISAQIYPDKDIHNLISEGLNYTLNQDYGSAKKIYQKLIVEYPDQPLGYIFLAGVSITVAVDYCEPFDDEFIMGNLDKAEEISDGLLYENDEDVWHNYFSALTNAYLAYYQALNLDYISAFTNGLTSILGFQKCLEIDENFFESYLAIGTYLYWKSEKMEFMNWLPFVVDERKEGIKLIERAIENTTYNKYLAINSLIWIYITEGKDSAAIELAEKTLEHFPNSRYLKWGLARAYKSVDKKYSIKIFLEILDSYRDIPGINRCNEITLKHKIAMIYMEMGNEQKALIYCNEILSIEDLDDFEINIIGSRIERVKQLRQNILQNEDKY